MYAKKNAKTSTWFCSINAGLSVHPSLPYLGASTDRKVFELSTDSKCGLLEIKCLFQIEVKH